MKTDIFCKANKEAADYIESEIMKASSICIIGHIRPDGDAVGVCLGLANYISIIKPEAHVKVFLEKIPETLEYLKGANKIEHDFSKDEHFDLGFMCDCSDIRRMGEAGKYFVDAGSKICIDHHVTNDGSYDGFSVVGSTRTSACEVLCTLIDLDKLDAESAECIYLGMVHDSGVFKYPNTSPETMLYAGKLIELGARNTYVIEKTFVQKTYTQNRALGRALIDAELALDGKFIYSIFTRKMMEEYFIAPSDLDGVVAQLRETAGVEAAAFVYETVNPGVFKVSLRSNDYVDVSKIAQVFDGGGHIKAAGFDMEEDPEIIIDIILAEVEKQI